MTDDPEMALDETTEETGATATATVAAADDPPAPVADASDATVSPSETAPVAETTVETTAEAATDGDDAEPPGAATAAADDADDAPAPVRRGIRDFVGTLLIAAGILTILLTVGITAWNRHQRDAETQAFLRRVTTPTVPGPAGSPLQPTPFPSTISGALVPDTAKTPTANVSTRAAQPVATTTDGKDRNIIAVIPAPVATPAPTASGDTAPTDAPSPTPKPKMPKPTHLTIPAINVDSNVIEVGISPIEIDGQQAYIWDVAPYAVGHNFSSADPGEGENVVLTGHDDWQGEVFKNLYKLKKGDQIEVQAGDRTISYHVDDILLLPEVGQPLEKRIENAKFIGTTGDERLTLVTCWPYGVDDHRLIVIARPNQ